MDWITENIAIGNYIDARNVTVGQVNAILCLKPDCCDENHAWIDILCLPLIDGAGNQPRTIADAVDFIDEVVSSGEKILVHCHAGRSRSVCVVARYFMTKHNLTSRQALELISNKRTIYLSPGIEETLTS